MEIHVVYDLGLLVVVDGRYGSALNGNYYACNLCLLNRTKSKVAGTNANREEYPCKQPQNSPQLSQASFTRIDFEVKDAQAET